MAFAASLGWRLTPASSPVTALAGLTQHLLIDLARSLGGASPGKLLRALPSSTDQVVAHVRILYRAHDLVGNISPVMRINVKGGIPTHFRQRRSVGSNDGQPVGHRLEHRNAEALLERGKQKYTGGLIEDREAVGWSVPEVDDPGLESRGADIVEHSFGAVAFASAQHQPVFRGQESERGESVDRVLAGLDHADAQDHFMALAHQPFPFPQAILRRQALGRQVNASRNDRNALATHVA